MVPDTLSFMAATKYKNKIWCSNLNFNGLFSIDVTDGKINYIGRFAGYDEDCVGLHRMAEVYKNRLFFFPNYSTSIDSYDLAGNFNSCNICSWEKEKKTEIFTCTSGVFLWKDIYYIFPRFPKMDLIKFSPDENKICEEIDLKLANELVKNEEGTLSFNCIRVGKDIYLPIRDTNNVVKYDLETGNEYKIVLPGTKRITGAMDFDGRSFWLNSDDEIRKYDITLKRQLSAYPYSSENEGIITKFVFRDNLTFVLPAYFGTVKVIDAIHGDLQEIKIDTSKLTLQLGPIAKWRHTESCIYFDDFFAINPVGLNSCIRIDHRTFKMTEKMLKIPSESIPIKNYSKKINYEYKKNDLGDFLNFIMYHKGKCVE